MKLIILNGDSCKGKSPTLNLVYDTLVGLGARVINPRKRGEGNALGNPVQNDFEAKLRYKCQEVAFYTMGDGPERGFRSMGVDKVIWNYIKNEDGRDCDVLIVALNSNDFKAIPNFNVNTVILQKRVSDIKENEIALNLQDCNDIIALI